MEERKISYVALLRPARGCAGEDIGGYFTQFPDIPGCMSQGRNIPETKAAGEGALKMFLSYYISKNGEAGIPEPKYLADVKDLDETHYRVTLDLEEILKQK